MPNVTIRDVPAEVHSILLARAAATGMSLQQYLAALLRREAGAETTDATTARWRAMARERIERGTASPFDGIAIIEAGREEHAERIVELTHGPRGD